MHKSKINTRSNLGFFRKREGLSQKALAVLIGHRDVTMISKYEHGVAVPRLRVGMKLEQIFRARLSMIFPGFSCQCEEELTIARSRLALSRT